MANKIKNMYVVFDKVKDEYSLPMVADDDIEAIRMFYVQCETIPTMNLMPYDFELWFIGYYNSEKGEVEYPDENTLIITGMDALDVFRNKKGDLNEV